MKRFFLSLFLGAFVLGSTAFAEKFSRTETRFFTISPDGKVKVENVNGAIKVEAWDGNQVSLQITKTVRAGDSDEADEYFNRLRVEIESGNNFLEVKTHYPHEWGGGFFDWLFHSGSRYVNVEYVLKVPKTVNVDLESTNGGLSVTGVTGSVETHTTNGAIDLENVGGTVDGTTTNGGIIARIGEEAQFNEMYLSTTNGGIRVYCPGDINADVEASTTNGGIHSDFPISVEGNFGGRHLEGKINGGGNELHLHTTNGGISIYKE